MTIKDIKNIDKPMLVFPVHDSDDIKEYIDFFEHELNITGVTSGEKLKVEEFKYKGNRYGLIDCEGMNMSKLSVVRLQLRMVFGLMWLDDFLANY